jgi:hypothetical protein
MLSSRTTPFFPAGLGKALVLFGVIFCIYMTPSKLLVWGDTIPNRYLPFSIIREFNLTLDEFVSPSASEIPYFLQHRNGYFVSSYPITPAILAVPFYVVPVLLGMTYDSPWMPLLEKLSASSIALLSAVFLYLALRRMTTEGTRLVVTAIYALCTSTFSISSQALWQHGPSQLFLSLGLYLLMRGLQEENLIPWSGFPLGAAIVSRPTDVLMVLPVIAYLCRYQYKFLLTWILFSVPPVILLLSYNHFYLGSIFDSGYSATVLDPHSSYWSAPFLYGLFGILVSPSRVVYLLTGLVICLCWDLLHLETPE